MSDWRTSAACLDKTWMAQKGHAEEARAVCAKCPVFEDCRRWVMTSDIGAEIPGIVAGLSVEQRGAIECPCGVIVRKVKSRNGKCWTCVKTPMVA